MPRMRTLSISGTPYEMGYQHGLAYREAICEITEERIHLCTDPTWTGRQMDREQVLSLAEACIPAHQDYAPDLIEQLEGIAAATGLSLPELIITNGFTDFVDTIYNHGEPVESPAQKGNECTSFIISPEQSSDRYGFLGQTWDMHASATPYVIMLDAHPADGPAFKALTVTGCVSMIGMNEAGIAVGINNLLGADGQIGVTWPFVCRKILSQTNIEDALACITEATLAGGHNFMIADAQGKSYMVEGMATVTSVTEITGDSAVHANTCLMPQTQQVERPLTEDLQVDSELRVSRAQQYLRDGGLTLDDLQALTRDRGDGAYSICSTSEPPFYTETCAAVIMRPATREFWGLWGLPHENNYERFLVNRTVN